ncbi:MAG: response regulator [Gemmatimonadota bacterium]|nr:response regulator [Gemmatimonadota bacterium]
MRLLQYRRALLAAIALAIPISGRAQAARAVERAPAAPLGNEPPVHDAWPQRDLLPGARFNQAVQSADGYLWLATTKGLLRFDGARAVPMNPPFLDSARTPEVLTVVETRDRGLWAGTANAGAFRLMNGAVTRWTTANGLPSDEVHAVYQDSSGALWIGTQRGLCRVEGAACRPVGPPGVSVLALGADWDGRLLVGGFGLFRLRGDTLDQVAGLPPVLYRVNRISTSPSGEVWVGTVSGLVHLTRPTVPGGAPGLHVLTTRDGLPGNYVFATLSGPGDELWVATLSGGIALRRHGRFIRIDERLGLTDSRVNDLMRDRDGDVWASTSGGLDRFRARAISTYTPADGLPDPLVWSVVGAPDGTVWLTTNAGGLTRFAHDTFTTWRNSPEFARSRISAIAPLADGTVFVAVRPDRLLRFDRGRFEDWSRRPGGPRGSVRAILAAAGGDVYFGSTDGLFRLHDGRFAPVALPGDSAARVIRALAQGPDGALWAGGNSLFRVARDSAVRIGRADAYDEAQIVALLPDSGRLWISTDGTGLRLLDGNHVSTLVDPDRTMLSDAFIVLGGRDGGLWLGSSNGLQRVNKHSLISAAAGKTRNLGVRVVDKPDGLLSTEFNSAGGATGWVAPDGRLWLPGADGLVVVDPAVLRGPAAPPPVHIEAVLADDMPLALAAPLTLPHDTRQIRIDFTSLRLRSAHQLRFRYRLIGLDSAWIDAGPRRSAFYSSLPGGQYEFQVSASDDAGLWNPHPATLDFRVVPPFVRTPGFPLLLALGAVLLAGAVVSLRGRALRAHARVLAAEVAERTADLRHQIANRERAEHALREARDHLELRVAERTADLARLNEEMRLNQERLNLLVRQLPAAVWTIDGAGRIVSLVGSGLSALGIAPAQRIGGAFADFIDDSGVLLAVEDAHDHALRGAPSQWQQTYRGHVFEWRIEPLRDDGGGVQGAVGLAFDVTEQARLREQVLHTQRLDSIGRLAGGLAHDLNNILTAVLGYTELSQQGIGDDVRSNLDEIRFAAERAAALTRQLLTFARRQKTAVQPVDLNATLLNVNRLLQRLLVGDVQLVTEPGADTPTVLADPNQIEQVIMNLAVNARDAMPDGGRLTVATSRVDLDVPRGDIPAGAYALLTVTDTGVGMTDEVRSHAFEPFYTTKELGKGTGLGLSTSFGIVRESGGHIELDTAPGRGTTVRVWLPAHGAAARADRTRTPLATVVHGSETVLVAEDEPQVRELTRRTLESFGYLVLTAGDGEDALRVADEYGGPIHLLLADLRMPRMGGYALAAELLRRRPGVRIAFMSGYSDGQPPDHPVLAAAPRLAKPFRVTALGRTVREALGPETKAAPHQTSRGPGAPCARRRRRRPSAGRCSHAPAAPTARAGLRAAGPCAAPTSCAPGPAATPPAAPPERAPDDSTCAAARCAAGSPAAASPPPGPARGRAGTPSSAVRRAAAGPSAASPPRAPLPARNTGGNPVSRRAARGTRRRSPARRGPRAPRNAPRCGPSRSGGPTPSGGTRRRGRTRRGGSPRSRTRW